MYKTRLQEICQKKFWAMPKYTSAKVGPDHSPLFTAIVSVNGISFETTHFAKSSKEAQGEAAKLAFDHFTTPEPVKDPSAMQVSDGSFGRSNELTDTPIAKGTLEPKVQELLKNSQSNGINSNVNEDIELKEMLYSYKNQLQSLAQRRNMELPVYNCVRDGCQPQATCFKATVTVDGQTFESPELFRTVKEAEQAAAKAALTSLSAGSQAGALEDENGFYKNMLQEFSSKEGFSSPIYKTITSGASHMLTFFSTVEVQGDVFSGKAAKTKRKAEMNAAKVALSTLNERKSSRTHASFDQDISFLQSCVTIDLPPKLRPQNPAPRFSFQASVESEDNDHEKAGRFTMAIPSLSYRAQEAHQHIASTSLSSIIPDLQPNLGNISNSIQMSKIEGSKDDSEVTGEAQENVSSQILDNGKARINDLTPSIEKSCTDAVLQHVELSSPSDAMRINKKSDMTYARLRDPFPSSTEDEISSSSSMPSECSGASGQPTGFPGGGSGSSFLGSRIHVYPRMANMTLPKGAIVLPISDDKWVAAKLEFPKG